MLTVDAETDKELQRRDLVKGYEFKKNHYLLMSDADFESVKVEKRSRLPNGLLCPAFLWGSARER
jgi:DNA end-binding protein Ku